MTKRNDPMGTLPIFGTTTTAEGRVVAAGRFRCGLCNTMGVDEPGELCQVCAQHVLTEKCRYRRTPTIDKAAGKAARKPRKTATRKTAKRKATAGKSTAARESTVKAAASAEGVA